MTTDITEPQKIIRGSDKKLHANKLDNLKEMKKFLETHNLLKLDLKKGNVNKTLTSKEIESVIKIPKYIHIWILDQRLQWQFFKTLLQEWKRSEYL